MHKTVLDVEGFVGVDAHFGVEVGRFGPHDVSPALLEP
jgi:hypothetical protein